MLGPERYLLVSLGAFDIIVKLHPHYCGRPYALVVELPISNLLANCQERIRIGNLHDGGYVLCATDLQDSDFLMSFGVSDDWTFEEAFRSLNSNSPIHAYDHTVDLIVFVKKSIGSFPRLLLKKITPSEFKRRVFLPFSYSIFFQNNRVHFKEKVTSPAYREAEISIESIFDRTNSSSIFLKMDIEGSEYKVLSEIIGYSNRITGMVIEFHDIHSSVDKFLEGMVELAKYFDIIHVHGNNYGSVSDLHDVPNVIELTFSRKETHDNRVEILSTPILGLDSPNNPQKVDLHFTISSAPLP